MRAWKKRKAAAAAAAASPPSEACCESSFVRGVTVKVEPAQWKEGCDQLECQEALREAMECQEVVSNLRSPLGFAEGAGGEEVGSQAGATAAPSLQALRPPQLFRRGGRSKLPSPALDKISDPGKRKAELRKLRNRETAAPARERRLQYLAGLESRVTELEEENEQLKLELRQKDAQIDKILHQQAQSPPPTGTMAGGGGSEPKAAAGSRAAFAAGGGDGGMGGQREHSLEPFESISSAAGPPGFVRHGYNQGLAAGILSSSCDEGAEERGAPSLLPTAHELAQQLLAGEEGFGELMGGGELGGEALGLHGEAPCHCDNPAYWEAEQGQGLYRSGSARVGSSQAAAPFDPPRPCHPRQATGPVAGPALPFPPLTHCTNPAFMVPLGRLGSTAACASAAGTAAGALWAGPGPAVVTGASLPLPVPLGSPATPAAWPLHPFPCPGGWPATPAAWPLHPFPCPGGWPASSSGGTQAGPGGMMLHPLSPPGHFVVTTGAAL